MPFPPGHPDGPPAEPNKTTKTEVIGAVVVFAFLGLVVVLTSLGMVWAINWLWTDLTS